MISFSAAMLPPKGITDLRAYEHLKTTEPSVDNETNANINLTKKQSSYHTRNVGDKSLSKLYLKGHNVLKLEAQAARKSSNLLILNPSNYNFNAMAKLQPKTCLIEQQEDSLTPIKTSRSPRSPSLK